MPLPRREMEEINHPNFPRRRLSPMGELDMIDVMIERHAEDMRFACCARDPGTHRDDEPMPTPEGMPGIDPIDARLGEADFGRDYLKRIEPVDTR